MRKVDLVIVGGGCAGLSGAISAFDEGIKDILILERNSELGGILNQCIHNGFGLGEFKEELTGPEFAYRFVKEVEKRHIPYLCNTYVSEITKDKIVRYSNEEGYFELQAKAILFAAGCFERSAGSIALPGDRPSGVISAGVAQLLLNRYGYMPGKKVFILGSGDIGLIMARRLTLEGAEVLGVAELCAWSNGLNRNIVQCLEDFDIPLYLSTTVTRVFGKDRLEAIELSSVDASLNPIPGSQKRIECDTLVLSVGLIPNNSLLEKAGALRGSSRGALVNDLYETTIPGIFSAGNVLHVHDLADNVVSEARSAGKEASRYIRGLLEKEEKRVPVLNQGSIGYVVPSFISYPLQEEKVSLKFRVRKPLKNVFIVLKNGEKEIKRIFKPFLIPSEMEIVALPRSFFEQEAPCFVLSIEEKRI